MATWAEIKEQRKAKTWKDIKAERGYKPEPLATLSGARLADKSYPISKPVEKTTDLATLSGARLADTKPMTRDIKPYSAYRDPSSAPFDKPVNKLGTGDLATLSGARLADINVQKEQQPYSAYKAPGLDKLQESVDKTGRTFGTDVKEAVPFVGKQVVAGMSDVNKGLMNLPRMLHTGISTLGAKMQGKEFQGDAVTDFLGGQIEREEKVGEAYGYQGDNPAIRAIGGALRSVPQVAPMMAGLTKAQGLGMIGAQSFGGGGREIEQEGGNIGQQFLGAGAKAGLEMATEAPALGTMVDILGGKAGLKAVGKQALEEFFGESISEALNPFIDSAVLSKELELATAGRIIEAGITGSLSALITGGTSAGIQSATKALRNPTEANIRELASDIEEKTGQKITESQVEQMVEEVKPSEVTKDTYLHSTNQTIDKAKVGKDGFLYLSKDTGKGDTIAHTIAKRHEKIGQPSKTFAYEIDDSKVKLFDAFVDPKAKEIIEKHGLPSDRSTIKWDDLPSLSKDIRENGYNMVEVLEPNNDVSYAISDMDILTATTQPTTPKAVKQDDGHAPQSFDTSAIKEEDGKLKTLYHATSADFDTFDLGKGGETSTTESAKHGFYFTDSKEVADTYRVGNYDDSSFKEYLNSLTDEQLLEVGEATGYDDYNADASFSRERTIEQILIESTDGYGKHKDPLEGQDYLKNTFEVIENEGLGKFNQEAWSKFKEVMSNKTGKVMDVNLDIKNPYVVEDVEYFDDDVYTEKINEAKAKGHDGVIMKNVDDSVTEYTSKDTIPSDIYIVFSPDQIHTVKPTQATTQPTTPKLEAPKTMDAKQVEQELAEIEKATTAEEVETALKELDTLEAEAKSRKIPMNAQLFSQARNSLMEKAKALFVTPTVEETKESKFAQGVETKSPTINKLLKDNPEYYNPTTNKLRAERAKELADGYFEESIQLIKEGGTDTSLDAFLLDELLPKLETQGRVEEAADLIQFISQKATKAGQYIQSFSHWAKKSPSGALAYADRLINNMIKDAKNTKEYKADPTILDEDIKLIRKYLAESQKLEGRARDIAIARATQLAANRKKSSFNDKQRTLRRISMLLNPKTQVRNLGGNLIMMVAENTSQAVATGVDKVVSKVYGTDRTTTLPKLKPQIEGFKKGFKETIEDYKLGIDTSAVDPYEAGQSKEVFRNKSLNKVNNFLNFIMEVGDRPFFQAAYSERMAEYDALGIELTTEAELEAIEFALERVFQNKSSAAEMASGLKGALNKIPVYGDSFGMGDIVLPFTKTPANILAKGLQYSPAGLVSAIKNAPTKSKIKSGKFNQKKFVDAVGRSMTGTAVMTLGFLLAKAGLATGSYDKDRDKEQLEKLGGVSNFSFKIGDTYYPFDWAQPISIPLSVGVEMANAMKDEKDLLKAIEEGVIAGGNTLLNQSMLQGFSRMLGGYNPTSGILETVKEAPLQYIPTLFGQVARTIDPKDRKVDYSNLGEQAMAKTPGLRQLLPPKITQFGEEATKGTFAERAVNNFLLPFAPTKTSEDKVAVELLSLNKLTGASNILPRVAPDSLDQDNKTYQLDAEKQNEMQTIMGKETYKEMLKLITSSRYKNMTDEEKAKALYDIEHDSYLDSKETIIDSLKE